MTLIDESFDQLAAQVNNWGRWGAQDELGTVNFITPQMRAQAAQSVRTGDVVSLARILELGTSEHTLQSVHIVWRVFEPVLAASEYLGLAFHGPAVTHLDSLNHIHSGEQMYNRFPVSDLKPKGGGKYLTAEVFATRLCGRGVLLDVARTRGVPALRPDEAVTIADLEAAEEAQGVRVVSGDLLFVRMGAEHWGFEAGTPGLAAEAAGWLHERQVAVLGSDAATDVMPGPPGGTALPLHQLAIVHMGLPLIDNCALEDLGRYCAEHSRYDFFACMAPLRLTGSTGSPLNPLAVF
jgi:kynurenine formamidase